MSASLDSDLLDGDPQTPTSGSRPAFSHVAIATRRLLVAERLIGTLAIVSFGLVFFRLVERWRVSAHATSHRIAILGHSLSYPVANLSAIIVLGMALLGVSVAAVAIVGVARELRSSRRAGRLLIGCDPSPMADAFVIEDARPRAFCVGLLRTRIYVTTGALAILDREALAVVLAHERHHARRRDPLRLAASRVLARALFFLPGVAELGSRREALSEMSADECAIKGAPENRSALARAMLSFTDSPAADASVGVDPARVDHLLGEPPSWRFPTVTFLVAVLLLALLAAVAVLIGQEAAGSASLAPPFLSTQPCVVVLALLPAGLTLAALKGTCSKRLAARTR